MGEWGSGGGEEVPTLHAEALLKIVQESEDSKLDFVGTEGCY